MVDLCSATDTLIACLIPNINEFLESRTDIYDPTSTGMGSLRFVVRYKTPDSTYKKEVIAPITKTSITNLVDILSAFSGKPAPEIPDAISTVYSASIDLSENIVKKNILIFGQALATNREGRKFPLIPVKVQMPIDDKKITIGQTFGEGSDAYDNNNISNTDFGAYRGFFEFLGNDTFGSNAGTSEFSFLNYNIGKCQPISPDTTKKTKIGLLCDIFANIDTDYIDLPLEYIYSPNGKVIRTETKRLPLNDTSNGSSLIFNPWDISLNSNYGEINNAIGTGPLTMSSIEASIKTKNDFIEIAITGGLGPWSIDGGPYLEVVDARVVEGSSLSPLGANIFNESGSLNIKSITDPIINLFKNIWLFIKNLFVGDTNVKAATWEEIILQAQQSLKVFFENAKFVPEEPDEYDGSENTPSSICRPNTTTTNSSDYIRSASDSALLCRFKVRNNFHGRPEIAIVTGIDSLGQIAGININVEPQITTLQIYPPTITIMKGFEVPLFGVGGSDNPNNYKWSILPTNVNVSPNRTSTGFVIDTRNIVVDTNLDLPIDQSLIGITLEDEVTGEIAYGSIFISKAEPIGLAISHSVCNSNISSVTWNPPSGFTEIRPEDFDQTWTNITWDQAPSLNFSDITNAHTGDVIPLCAYALLSDGTIQNVTNSTDFKSHNPEAGNIIGSSLKINKGGSNIITGVIKTANSQTGSGTTVYNPNEIISVNAINVSSSDGLKINPITSMLRTRNSTSISNFNTDLSPLSVQEMIVTGGEDSDLFIWSITKNESGGCLLKGRFSTFTQTPLPNIPSPFPCYDSLSIQGSDTRYVSYVAGTDTGNDVVEVINTQINSNNLERTLTKGVSNITVLESPIESLEIKYVDPLNPGACNQTANAVLPASTSISFCALGKTQTNDTIDVTSQVVWFSSSNLAGSFEENSSSLKLASTNNLSTSIYAKLENNPNQTVPVITSNQITISTGARVRATPNNIVVQVRDENTHPTGGSLLSNQMIDVVINPGTVQKIYRLHVEGESGGCLIISPSTICTDRGTIDFSTQSNQRIFYFAGSQIGEDRIILTSTYADESYEALLTTIKVIESPIERVEIFVPNGNSTQACDDPSLSRTTEIGLVDTKHIGESLVICAIGFTQTSYNQGLSGTPPTYENAINLTPIVEWFPTDPRIGEFKEGHLVIENDVEVLVTARYTQGSGDNAREFISNSIRIKPIPKVKILPGNITLQPGNNFTFNIQGGGNTLFVSRNGIGGVGSIQGQNSITLNGIKSFGYTANTLGTDSVTVTDGFTSETITVTVSENFPRSIQIRDNTCSNPISNLNIPPLSGYSFCAFDTNLNKNITSQVNFASINANAGTMNGNTFKAASNSQGEVTTILATFSSPNGSTLNSINQVSINVAGRLNFLSNEITTVKRSSSNISNIQTQDWNSNIWYEVILNRGNLLVGDILNVTGSSQGCLIEEPITNNSPTQLTPCNKSLIVSSNTNKIFYIAGPNIGTDTLTIQRGEENISLKINVIKERPQNINITVSGLTGGLNPRFYTGESPNIIVTTDKNEDITPFVELNSSNLQVGVINQNSQGITFLSQGATTISAILNIGESDALNTSIVVSAVNFSISPTRSSYPKRGSDASNSISYPFSVANPISQPNGNFDYNWSLSGDGCISTSNSFNPCEKNINTSTNTSIIYYLPSTIEGTETLSVRDLNRSVPPASTTFQIVDNKPESISIGKTQDGCKATTNSIDNLVYGDQISLCAIANYSDGSTKNVTPFVTWAPQNPDFGIFKEGMFRITSKEKGETTISASYIQQGFSPIISNALRIYSEGTPRLNVSELTLNVSEFGSTSQTFRFKVVNADKFDGTYEWVIASPGKEIKLEDSTVVTDTSGSGSVVTTVNTRTIKTDGGGGTLVGPTKGVTEVVYKAGSRVGTDIIQAVNSEGKGIATAYINLEASPVVALYISHNTPLPYKLSNGQTATNLWSDSRCRLGLDEILNPKIDQSLTTNFKYSPIGSGGVINIAINFPAELKNPDFITNIDPRSSLNFIPGGATYKPGHKPGETGRDNVIVLNNGIPFMRFWFDIIPNSTNTGNIFLNSNNQNSNDYILDVIFHQERIENSKLILPPNLHGRHVEDRIPMCASGLLENGQIVNMTDKVTWISSNADAGIFEEGSQGTLFVKNGGQSFISAYFDTGNGTRLTPLNGNIELQAFDRLSIIPTEAQVSTNSYIRLSIGGGFIGGDDFTYPDHPFSVSVAGTDIASCVAGKQAYLQNTSSGNVLFNSNLTNPFDTNGNLLEQLQNNITRGSQNYLNEYAQNLLQTQSLQLSECRTYIEVADPRALQDIYFFSGPREGTATITVSDGYSEAKSTLTILPKSYAFLGIAPIKQNLTVSRKSDIKTRINEYPDSSTRSKFIEPKVGESIALGLYGTDSFESTQTLQNVYETATWTSSNPSIVQIDQSTGVANILDEGTVSITAKIRNTTSQPLIIEIKGEPVIERGRFIPDVISPGRTTKLSVFIQDARGKEDIEIAGADLLSLNIIPVDGAWTMKPGQVMEKGAWFNLDVTIPTSVSPGVYSINIKATDKSKNISNNSQDFKLDLIVIDKILPGDVSGDSLLTLKDAVLALQISVGRTPSIPFNPLADVNGDRKVGLAEAVFVLKKISGLL